MIISDIMRLEALVTGEVQAVGFRYWTLKQAQQLRLSGSAANQNDGSVRIIAEGEQPDVEELLRRLRSGRTPGQVENVEATLGEGTGALTGFDTR